MASRIVPKKEETLEDVCKRQPGVFKLLDSIMKAADFCKKNFASPDAKRCKKCKSSTPQHFAACSVWREIVKLNHEITQPASL